LIDGLLLLRSKLRERSLLDDLAAIVRALHLKFLAIADGLLQLALNSVGVLRVELRVELRVLLLSLLGSLT
jgi:hypothetical protein